MHEVIGSSNITSNHIGVVIHNHSHSTTIISVIVHLLPSYSVCNCCHLKLERIIYAVLCAYRCITAESRVEDELRKAKSISLLAFRHAPCDTIIYFVINKSSALHVSLCSAINQLESDGSSEWPGEIIIVLAFYELDKH